MSLTQMIQRSRLARVRITKNSFVYTIGKKAVNLAPIGNPFILLDGESIPYNLWRSRATVVLHGRPQFLNFGSRDRPRFQAILPIQLARVAKTVFSRRETSILVGEPLLVNTTDGKDLQESLKRDFEPYPKIIQDIARGRSFLTGRERDCSAERCARKYSIVQRVYDINI
tara:strand:- start:150 stop:659 length:510 start_codon:yes stop_codon:yes gene_type:complete